jgi:NADH-quinone oxidoreductase subunit G
MPKITVDGKTIECKDKQMILQAADDAGINIPRYCYHPGLSIVASCRICLVEVEGIPKLVPSCQTAVREGMVVHTNSPKAVANQKQVMEYLLINHPLDCPVCDQAGECYLQDYSYQYGRSQSRFEEDKVKQPKKDVGENIVLYSDRCIMCTRCVRFTREVSGTCELFVDGRGHKEEIEIFPGKPLNNKLSGNVADICPVGALLDKSFLFKQRVWLLKQVPSISPVDAGGENIWIDQNEGRIFRQRPRFNEKVNKWWISDDTRYSWKGIQSEDRLRAARKLQYGTQVDFDTELALQQALTELKNLAATPGSLYAMLSPMMSCEEAYLLGKLIRSLDPQAVLVTGPATTGPDEVFKHYLNGNQTFVIKGEKVPNMAGIKRVIELLGGPSASYEQLVKSETPELKKLKGGWIVGGYLKDWLPKEQPAMFKKGYRVVQDLFANGLVNSAEIVIPAAAWCEKDGTWENYQNILQVFSKAVNAPEGVVAEGEIYARALNRAGAYTAAAVRVEMAGPFAEVVIPAADTKEPEMEFVEL